MYHETAQGLASLGRNQDSMLVHMTPGEVQGLQKLAMSQGGSLTINPQTGLPEAGFLSSMLPMLAAAAAIYFTGGAAAPAVAGMEGAAAGAGAAAAPAGLFGLGASGTGALAGAATGALTNRQNPMMGALMGGISGYGMGNIGTALGGAMAPTAETTAAQTALANSMGEDAVLDQSVNAQNALDAAKANDPGFWNKFIGNPATKTAAATGLGGGVGALKSMIPLAAPLLAPMMTRQNTLSGVKPAAPSFYNTTYNPTKFNPATGTYDPAYYGPGSYGPTANIAQGGIIGYADGGGINPEAYAPTGSASKDAESMYSDANPTGQSPEDVAADRKSVSQLQRDLELGTAPQMAAAKRRLQDIAAHQVTAASSYTTHAAHGGLMGLHSQTNDYAAGGKLLRGPGDGMSDSIPAVIDGPKPQRAALADGEFVIPADVVSHLGNGSTEAGSKHLYSMMDKVRRARTGNPKQGKQINPARFMPA